MANRPKATAARAVHRPSDRVAGHVALARCLPKRPARGYKVHLCPTEIPVPMAAKCYASEVALVDDFMTGLKDSSPWGGVRTAAEFYYGSGRTDVVALNAANELLAFEAKLTRWKDALHQAFRSTFFAAHSFVVLPEKAASKAAAFRGEFERRKVGLCSVKNGQISVLIPAQRVEPINPWLAAQAAEAIGVANAGYSAH